MGGWAPLGYDIRGRKLVINTAEAASVRTIFQRLVRERSMTKLIPILAKEGITAKSGKPIDKGYLYRVINNRVYIGEAVHKGTAYPGEHEPIIERALWDRAHAILRESPRKRAAASRARTPALLKGIVFGPTGTAMTPTHTRRNGRLYRYYVSTDVLKRDSASCTLRRVPAAEIENAVIDQLRGLVRDSSIVVRAWRTARKSLPNISEVEVRRALERFDPLWDELFPAEQARVVQLLVERVEISSDGLDIRLRVEGLADLARDLGQLGTESPRAA